MNHKEILTALAKVKGIDEFAWAKADWPSREDLTICSALDGLMAISEGRKKQLIESIMELVTDRSLEVFAYRAARNATNRGDLLYSYLALHLCKSQESRLLALEIDEITKASGINPRKLSKRAALMIQN